MRIDEKKLYDMYAQEALQGVLFFLRRHRNNMIAPLKYHMQTSTLEFQSG